MKHNETVRTLEEYRLFATLKDKVRDIELLRYFFHAASDLMSGVREWNHYKYDASVYLSHKKDPPQKEYGPSFPNGKYFPEKEYSPLFSAQLYRELCTILSRDSRTKFVNMEQYIDGKVDRHHFNVVLRHDIDTKFCIKNIEGLVTIEQELGLSSSIYVICDGSRYHPAEASKMVESMRQKNCLVGLHTLAHGSNDPMKYLQFEIDQFMKHFGFRPRTFLPHGIYPRPENYRQKVRRFRRLARHIANDLCIKPPPHTRFGEPKFTERTVYADGTYRKMILMPTSKILNTLYLGESLMVITHPWLWQTH